METSCMPPNWLPPMHVLSGDIPSDLTALYAIYRRDLRVPNLFLLESRVRVNGRPDYEAPESYEKGFWHLVSHDTPYGREFEERRAARLPWCMPMIRNPRDPSITSWNYLEAQKGIRTYLWLRGQRYVVILAPVRNSGEPGELEIVTAFFVNKEKEEDLESKYKRRILR